MAEDLFFILLIYIHTQPLQIEKGLTKENGGLLSLTCGVPALRIFKGSGFTESANLEAISGPACA